MGTTYSCTIKQSENVPVAKKKTCLTMLLGIKDRLVTQFPALSSAMRLPKVFVNSFLGSLCYWGERMLRGRGISFLKMTKSKRGESLKNGGEAHNVH